MIQQSVAQFTRNAQKATSIVDDEKLPDRQRGMWSFLTWSFFLAQAVAAHEAYAKGHMLGEDLQGDSSDPTSADAGTPKALAAASALGVSGFDGDPTAAALFAAAMAAGAITPQMWGAFQNDPAMFKAFIDSLVAQGDGAQAMFFGEWQASAADGIAGEGTDGHGPTDPGIHIPGIDLPGVTLPIDIAIDLGLELGSDIGLGIHLDGLNLGLNLNVGSLANLNLGGGELDLKLLGIDLGTGEHGVLGNLLGSTPINLAHVVDATGLPDLLGHTLPKLTEPLSDVVEAVKPVTTILTGTLDSLSDHGLLASGGTIVQSVANPLLSTVNDIFQNGAHTAYGVTLAGSSDTHGSGSYGPLSGHLTAGVDVDDLGAFAGDTLHHAGETVSHLLPSVIEELNLRGFGDGISV